MTPCKGENGFRSCGSEVSRSGATIFSVTRQKIWKKNEPKRDAFAPLFGNTQQTDAKNAETLTHFRTAIRAPASLALLRW